MSRLEVRRVMVVTDPYLSGSEAVATACRALREAGLDAVLFDEARVEPTDRSIQAAIDFASEGRFDGYVAVGGGSSIDTAKAAKPLRHVPRGAPGIRQRAGRALRGPSPAS